MEQIDVIVIGAGISGIDAAHNLKTRCPQLSFAVLERRATFGGTWDLFKYPGIRSDSDMFTFGYDFKPWTSEKPIAPAADIREYLEGAIVDEDLSNNIRFGHHVIRAEWSSQLARWQLLCENGKTLQCWFLYSCAGYYNYDQGWEPPFQGTERFECAGGRIVHPQKWTDDIVYKDKSVVVIGSGATAVTLVPALADEASHVTMLQRSPTYILPAPNIDPIAAAGVKDGLSRAEIHQRVREHKAQADQTFLNQGPLGQLTQEQKNAEFVRWMRLSLSEKYMSDQEFAKNFTPRYNIWEQRLCVSPDADFFRAIKKKKVSVVTDHIDHFDETGIVLKSGQRLNADMVVTATGLQLHDNAPMATMHVSVDGKAYVARDHHIYKDCMLTDVPNFAFCTGYFQASWTLKADLVCHFVCRLLLHLRERGLSSVQARLPAEGVGEAPPIPDSGPGYVRRNQQTRPKYGTAAPWVPLQSYLQDKELLENAPLVDDVLEFAANQPRLSRL